MDSDLTVYGQVQIAKQELKVASMACNIICLAIGVVPPVILGGISALLVGSLGGAVVFGLPSLFFFTCLSVVSRLWLFTPSDKYKKYIQLESEANKLTEETVKSILEES